LQVRCAESGERLACNLQGTITIGADIIPFNIHTNQAHQADYCRLSKFNPYIWVVPCAINVLPQPTGCIYVTTDTKISIHINCDVENVFVDCWASCFRCLRQNIAGQNYKYNEIGFIRDIDLPKPIPKNLSGALNMTQLGDAHHFDDNNLDAYQHLDAHSGQASTSVTPADDDHEDEEHEVLFTQ
jgi:hypothetical protein